MPTGLAIRKATRSDFERLLEIERSCFAPMIAFSPRILAYLAFRGNSHCLVATVNGTIQGFIIIRFLKPRRIVTIDTLDIAPSFRRQGLATQLLGAAEALMIDKRVTIAKLEVSEGNHTAIGLYSRAGYTVVGRLEGYYSREHNGSRNAFVMIKKLKKSKHFGNCGP